MLASRPIMTSAALRLGAQLLPAVLGLASCTAVYPELTTPVRVPMAAQPLDPPPPPELVWISFREGTVPAKTRDGRAWAELGNTLPDPYVVLFLNGKELIRTNAQTNTLKPTWPGSPRGNFRFQRSDKLRVEMWHDALVKTPICVKNVNGDMDDWAAAKEIRVTCDGNGLDGNSEVILSWEPAHARLGYGFNYELRTEDVFVSRVFEESPAARAGMRPGDQLVTADGQLARAMKPGELQGYFNAQRVEGVTIELKHRDGQSATVPLKEGAIYPLFSEVGSLP